MTVARPFHRTCRPFSDGTYGGSGGWIYIRHPSYAKEPRHYIQAFLLLQNDLIGLFEYIEPAESNLQTYSHRVQQLLMRTCVEVEANFTAILLENGYAKKGHGNLSMHDYKLINRSHRLSSYEARLPLWRGPQRILRPFAPWAAKSGTLPWYQAYNASKHDRHASFHRATFECLLDAICALVILLSAQFCVETFAPGGKPLMTGLYRADPQDGMINALGDYFRVKFADDWPAAERYNFSWPEFDAQADPFANFDYAASDA